MAVASAGPYASLHLAPDRQPRQHPTTRFLQAGCPSCRPTNSVKALKAQNLIEFYRKCAGEFLENGIAYCENLPSYFNSGCSQLNEVLNFIDLLQ